MKDNIENNNKNEEEVNKKINELHNDISVLKSTVESLKKNGWAKSLLIRINNWLKDPLNRQLLKSGVEVAGSMLLESGKK